MNHRDNNKDGIETESLADLPVTDEQAEVTKAGSTVSQGTFTLTFNGQTTAPR